MRGQLCTLRHTFAILMPLAAAILAAIAQNAAACTIVDRHPVDTGLEHGIGGRCSNNGEPVTCFLNGARWQCDGPMGTFHGDDAAAVIVEACDCNLQEEVERKELEELTTE